MDFDESKKIEVAISENQFVESRIEEPRKRFSFGKHKSGGFRRASLDALDVAIIPITVGVFLSLGFLFASLIKVSAIASVIQEAGSVITNLL